MNLNRLFIAALAATATVTATQAQQALTASDITSIYKTSSRQRVSVHDPSVIHTTGQTFYIFGSHRGVARSTDGMKNWQGVSNTNLFNTSFNTAFNTQQVHTVRALVGGQMEEVAFQNFDAEHWASTEESWIEGVMWAPDVVWNPNLNKWCYYLSVNGDAWHSSIILLTANNVAGPYTYQGPVVISGFDGSPTSNNYYKKTDLELVLGTQASLPARYNLGNRWGDTYPNNIDPCVFWDEEGELWIAYGSWSGGIFMLRLDKTTGLRDYTQSYPDTWSGSTLKSDSYFGTHIAGGYYVSGEGPYIQHIGSYYYLFMSYGGFAPDGGYEMRIFRSKNPDGPYVDANGVSALYSRWEYNVGPGATTNRGMKLMGSYNGWGLQTVGECAQGHNSATGDDQGRNFVVYHTKFNDGTIGHQVRTRQLFLNADGWICAAPFEFDGETVNDDSIAAGCHYAKDDIPGTYEVLIHRYKLDHEQMEEVKPVSITLADNGRVTGDLTGTWAMTDGTAYISLKAGNVTYNGVVVPQTLDGTTLKAVGITAQAKSGVSLWAYKLEDASAVAYAYKNYTFPVRNNQSVNRNLPLAGYTPRFGATVTWTSSAPDIISDEGLYAPAETDTKVTLTCRIQAGKAYYEQAFTVTAQHEVIPAGDIRTGLVAYYNFESKPLANAYDESQTAYFGKGANGRVATLDAEPVRYGNVLHQYGGAAKAESYARVPNPLNGRELEGFTVAAYVSLSQAAEPASTLWGFTDKQGNQSTVAQRFYLTANATMAFETQTDDFTANELRVNANGVATNATGYIPAGEWAQVVVTANKEDGVTLYVNGTKKAHKNFTSSAGTASSVTQAAKLFDYGTLLTAIGAAGYFQCGIGGKAGTAEALIDDLLIYDRALTSTDVRALYTLSGRLIDFGPNGGNAISVVRATPTPSADAATYDLSGRRMDSSNLPRGIYVSGGRKTVVR